MTTDEEIKRIRKIQGLLQARLDAPAMVMQPMYFTYGELLEAGSREDSIVLKKVLDIIQAKTNMAIYWTVRRANVPIVAMTAGAAADEKEFKEKEVGVDINVSNPDQLGRYFSSIFAQLKKEAINDKLNVQHVFPFPLPSGFPWEQITVHFKNGHEVVIKANGKTHQTNFWKMGFQKGKSQSTPNLQWWFLHALAQAGGEAAKGLLERLSSKERDQLKSRKKMLVKQLCNYFELETDPFYGYRDSGMYRIKIVLLPESTKKVTTVDDNGDDLFGETESAGSWSI